MKSYLDRTFCASSHCTNKCGRQLTPELKAGNVSNDWISYAYFCGTPEKIDNPRSEYVMPTEIKENLMPKEYWTLDISQDLPENMRIIDGKIEIVE